MQDEDSINYSKSLMNKFSRLPDNIYEKLPLLESLKEDKRISALFLYGSAVKNNLSPLSDIDIAILLDSSFSNKEMFDIHLNITGKILDLLLIDEVDLQLLNTAPMRFINNILNHAKLMFCNNRGQLIDFTDQKKMAYLDFKYYKD